MLYRLASFRWLLPLVQVVVSSAKIGRFGGSGLLARFSSQLIPRHKMSLSSLVNMISDFLVLCRYSTLGFVFNIAHRLSRWLLWPPAFSAVAIHSSTGG